MLSAMFVTIEMLANACFDAVVYNASYLFGFSLWLDKPNSKRFFKILYLTRTINTFLVLLMSMADFLLRTRSILVVIVSHLLS